VFKKVIFEIIIRKAFWKMFKISVIVSLFKSLARKSVKNIKVKIYVSMSDFEVKLPIFWTWVIPLKGRKMFI